MEKLSESFKTFIVCLVTRKWRERREGKGKRAFSIVWIPRYEGEENGGGGKWKEIR